MTWEKKTGALELGDWKVERGGLIRDARLVWEQHGALNAARNNLILYPSSYTAQHSTMSWLIGPDGILDPTRWCILIVNMFSNGLSSGAAETPDYPALVTVADNVRAQHKLVTEAFGVEKLAAVYGFSMGGMQAYHWAALYPEQVARAIVVCGSARTADHNKVFLSALLRTLEAAPEHIGGGRFSSEPMATLAAFGHIYAGWGLSQDFYRAQLYRTALGAPDLESYLRRDWVERFTQRRAANLYAQALAWQHGDISNNGLYNGDLTAALRAIRAKVLLLPSETDLYFRVADNAAELPHLSHGAMNPIPSIWGHGAGNPIANPADAAFLRDQVRRWLES
ncbi:alpha/beta fold hydrolase [Terrarubrum flagellatum]|uniref:alpha/beta fold hydrolase n=1 Tax=Terrirubrum flagellatum TaxID=2895980 RepID=UPI0031452750